MTATEHATLHSMTGYGRGAAERGDVAVEVELRSVNSRHLAIKCRLSNELVRLEPKVEALVKKRLARGHVDVFARLRLARSRRTPQIDEGALKVYRDALQRLGAARGGGRAGRRSVGGVGDDAAAGAALLSLPGVVTLAEQELPATVVERLVMSALRDGLDALQTARAAEGARLAGAFRRELRTLEKHRKAIAKRGPQLVRQHHELLGKRLGSLLDERGLDPDDPVLRREVAVLADRGDVTEELDRLASHIAAVGDALAAPDPVGRQLDFLLQEVGREVNTIGSKLNDVTVTGHVVALKSAVEKLREQAANIE